MTVVGRRSGWRGYFTPGEREREGEGRDGDRQDCGLWKYELIFYPPLFHYPLCSNRDSKWGANRLEAGTEGGEIWSAIPRPQRLAVAAVTYSCHVEQLESRIYLNHKEAIFCKWSRQMEKRDFIAPISLLDLFPDVSLKRKIKEIKQICICGLLFLCLP